MTGTLDSRAVEKDLVDELRVRLIMLDRGELFTELP